jgi:ATP-dependent DNA helicase RecG
MIVHRDYTHHGNSSVKIFPDRIEFFNPGRLSDQISIADLLEGSYVSDCRNKQVARIFKEIEWIERYGTGIRRIKDYFKEYGSSEPVFENFQHGFRVTAYALHRDVTEKLGEKLGENQKKIIELMQNNSFVTISELSEQIQISETAIQNNIAKLKSLGLISREGPDKGGYWKVLKKTITVWAATSILKFSLLLSDFPPKSNGILFPNVPKKPSLANVLTE